MTKIDIFSGFLGAGKTTLIKKLIKEAYAGEKLVLIENEFGDIGIDGGFLQDAGINITEMNSGCICCSLVGDFGKALKQVLTDYAPDRILIEPSGVGKLSDVIRAVQDIDSDDIVLNAFTTVVDVNKCKMYMKNFGEFFNNQIECASAIILSHTTAVSDAKLNTCLELLREHNQTADILTTPWEQLTGAQNLEAMEPCEVCGEHHHHEHDHEHEHHHDHDHEHHHHHDEECGCGHDHHDHEHHHHDHDHHHEHGEGCSCGCGHDHDHHHHHHADEVFESIGVETTKKFTAEKIQEALEAIEDEHEYGIVLRAKGIVEAQDGTWIHFDYVPGEPDVRTGGADIIGKIVVIGSKMDKEKIRQLFEI